ncbi:hypothetical protein DFS34DRAFT_654223 [Phlyctochytrium arcticum]|nr:hypothetical protein DFS34DRAFT_654223 [Phlyctochytrium arcticum]
MPTGFQVMKLVKSTDELAVMATPPISLGSKRTGQEIASQLSQPDRRYFQYIKTFTMTETSETTTKKLRVPELKSELAKLGLPTTGKKEELVARLLDNLPQEPETSTAKPVQSNKPSTQINEADLHAELAQLEASTAGTVPGSKSPTKARAPSPVKKQDTPVNGGSAAKPTVVTTGASSGSVGTPSPTPLLSEVEKIKNRAARFGVQTPESVKQLERAARFGLPTTKAAVAPASAAQESGKKKNATPGASGAKGVPAVKVAPEVLKKRLERFGTVNPAAEKTIKNAEFEEQKRKRAERFGLPVAPEGGAKRTKV